MELGLNDFLPLFTKSICWKWISLSVLHVILIYDSKVFLFNNKIVTMYIAICFYFCLWTVQNIIYLILKLSKQSIQSAVVPLSLYFSAFLS